MANFPDSIYSPAAKSAGQTITAAFFNDPDGEITAIEQGYRNGTAPLNSSGSTVATLSVSGASTFASRPVMPPPDAARVTNTSTVAMSSAEVVIRNLKTQDFITNSSLHSTATNSSRITPQSTGLYRFVGSIAFSAVSSGLRSAQIIDSSGGVLARTDAAAVAGGDLTIVQVTGTKRFDVTGGYMRLNAAFTNASTLSISSVNTWVEVTKL